jgi:alpha-L-rhamnosidase
LTLPAHSCDFFDMRFRHCLSAMCLSATLLGLHADSLEDGFRNPPVSARPSIYYLLLNGYVNRAYVETEMKAYKDAGVGGLCLFDMGARGPADTVPPAGPAFLSRDSVADLAHIIRTAGRLGMEVNLSVTSSWDMGGSWVKPEDGSMTLISSETQIAGPRDFEGILPFPAAPKETPKDAGGVPLFFRDVAVLALPDAQRRDGWEFVFDLPKAFRATWTMWRCTTLTGKTARNHTTRKISPSQYRKRGPIPVRFAM